MGVEELWAQGQNFLLVFLRTSCLLLFWPLWDSRLLPLILKVSAMLVIALALTPAAAPHLPPWPSSWPAFLALVAREVLWGFSLGLGIRALMSGVQMAGNLASLQMGFGMVTLIDPQSQGQNALLGDLFLKVATLLFLLNDGHHLVLILLAQSFSSIPLKTVLELPGTLGQIAVDLAGWMYQVAVRLAAPVLAVVFLAQVALALVSRAVPQIQVMLLSFPMTIGLGLVVLSLTMTLAGGYFIDQLQQLARSLSVVMQALRG